MIDLRHSQATDPRDRVFAYLGIAKDAMRSCQIIHYTDVVKVHLNKDRTMEITCTHHRGYSDLELPSWVPDWSINRSSIQIGQ